jgi:hypothetical protein
MLEFYRNFSSNSNHLVIIDDFLFFKIWIVSTLWSQLRWRRWQNLTILSKRLIMAFYSHLILFVRIYRTVVRLTCNEGHSISAARWLNRTKVTSPMDSLTFANWLIASQLDLELKSFNVNLKIWPSFAFWSNLLWFIKARAQRIAVRTIITQYSLADVRKYFF